MLTQDEVIWAYKILLGREPESNDLIEYYVSSFDSSQALAAELSSSAEYLSRQATSAKSVLSPEAQSRQDFIKIVEESVEKACQGIPDLQVAAKPLVSLVKRVRQIKSLDFVLILGESGPAKSLVADLSTRGRPPHTILHLVGRGEHSCYCITSRTEAGLDSSVYIQANVTLSSFMDIFHGVPMQLDFVYVADPYYLEVALDKFYWALPESGLFLVEPLSSRDRLSLARIREFVQPLARDVVDHGEFLLVPKSYWYSQLPTIGRHVPAVISPNRAKCKLALASILKNEAHRVLTMLNSVKEIIDFASVVDTGSTDGTVLIVKDWLEKNQIDHVLREETFRDFSQSRNSALRAVPKHIDWVLMLDGDEFLEQHDCFHLVALMQSGEEGWALPRYNYTDEAMEARPLVYPDRQRRLFRNRPAAPHLFEGAVHEVLKGVPRWAVGPANLSGVGGPIGGPHIHHMGLVSTSEKWLEKHLFYQELAAR